jgi:uncharacterized protein YgfB (UPF0149 family)
MGGHGQAVKPTQRARGASWPSANITTMLQVTFREIASVLERAGSQVVAAEGHGCLVGALCTAPSYTFERWLDELIVISGDEDVNLRSDSALHLLFTDTHSALSGDQMAFEPLLPDDEEPLAVRATALAQWCQGFLYGFGTGNPPRPDQLKGAVEEVLRDVTHIARASVDVGTAVDP